MPDILFGIQSYSSPSLPLSAQRMLNWYFEKQPIGAKSQVPVFGVPGLTALYLLSSLDIRGMWNFNGVLHVVAADHLYSVSSAGVIADIGFGILGTSNVSISDNGVQIVIVNGTQGFIYGPSTPFQQIVNINFYPAKTVLFFDGYFIFDRVGTNEFFLSGLYDGLSYSGLDFASAEAQPGFLFAVAQNLQLLFLFCQNHIEMWYDAGSADFPFQRYAGGVIEKGIDAPLSVINQDEAIFFVGRDRTIYRLQGNVPQRISTHAIEAALESYGDISDCEAFTFTYRGHKMVCWTFPSVPHTWVWDLSTNMWHERESWDEQNVSLDRWRASTAITIYNQIVIGDFQSGQLWTLDGNNYTEGGNTIYGLIHSAPLHHGRQRVFIPRLELDMETGVGLNDGQGTDPQAMLRWSKDGARTWSILQPWRSMGKIGEYTKRLRWLGLGQAYVWVFALEISDPVKRVLIAAHADVELGMP